MSLLSRLFRSRRDPRDALRPLWHRVVEIAREPRWYAEAGVADTIDGRFDMIAAVLALVLLRMEKEPAMAQESVYLTELFVDDMDGQLREIGIGDIVVGKHIGRLMSMMGGRLGAYRDGLARGGDALAEAAGRNVRMQDGRAPDDLADGLAALAAVLTQTDAQALLAGAIVR
ncbi:MAG: hypothetical protein KDE61_10880 [Novosphingobium sp.]|nr:hypothetical protein [Novosphingobium sp.]MCP5379632.1 hypothetical protein [Novosphingobium sp.]